MFEKIEELLSCPKLTQGGYRGRCPRIVCRKVTGTYPRFPIRHMFIAGLALFGTWRSASGVAIRKFNPEQEV